METYYDWLWSNPSLRYYFSPNPEQEIARIKRAYSHQCSEDGLESMIDTFHIKVAPLHSGRIFKIGEEFESAIGFADLDVKGKFLKEAPISYVQLNHDYHLCNDISFNSFYYLVDVRDDGCRCIRLMVNYREKKRNTLYHGGLIQTIHDDENIGARMDRLEVIRPVTMTKGAEKICKDEAVQSINKHLPFLAKIILYIDSGNPDLRFLKKPNQSKYKQRKKNDDTTISDCYLVGYNWKKDILYNQDSTEVKAHLRWQPCGKGRSQVKLVIVRAHTRTYKNVRKLDNPYPHLM